MLFLCEILFFKPKRPSVVSCDIYNLRIIQEYFQPKIGRKIRILSLGRKNNILIKKRVYLNLCATEMGAFVFSLHACIVERKKTYDRWVFVLDRWVFVLDQWVFVLDQRVFVLNHRVFVLDPWVFVLDQWVFVLDHRVFVLDNKVLGLRSSFLGLRFRHIHKSN